MLKLVAHVHTVVQIHGLIVLPNAKNVKPARPATAKPKDTLRLLAPLMLTVEIPAKIHAKEITLLSTINTVLAKPDTSISKPTGVTGPSNVGGTVRLYLQRRLLAKAPNVSVVLKPTSIITARPVLHHQRELSGATIAVLKLLF